MKVIQNSYGKWCEVVKQSLKKVAKKQNNTNIGRNIRELMKMTKTLRKELNQSKDIKEKQQLKHRIRIIKEHIVEQNKEIRGMKVKKFA